MNLRKLHIVASGVPLFSAHHLSRVDEFVKAVDVPHGEAVEVGGATLARNFANCAIRYKAWGDAKCAGSTPAGRRVLDASPSPGGGDPASQHAPNEPQTLSGAGAGRKARTCLTASEREVVLIIADGEETLPRV